MWHHVSSPSKRFWIQASLPLLLHQTHLSQKWVGCPCGHLRFTVQANRALNFKVSGNIKCTSQVLIVAIQLAMVSSAPSDVNGLGLGAKNLPKKPFEVKTQMRYAEECNSTLQQIYEIYKYLEILCLYCSSSSNLYWLAFQGSLVDFRQIKSWVT